MHRRKVEKVFPLSDEELKRLSLDDSDSAIIMKENVPQRIRLNYSCLPVNSIRFRKAVEQELHKKILKYNHEKNDIILRFVNIRISKRVVANMNRKLNVECVADMFVFKPRANQILTAVVNKKSKNHIGCIMYEIFNVSIVKPNDLPYSLWNGRDVQLNDEIQFKVQEIAVAEVIPYIVGELILDTDDDSSCREIYEVDSVISLDPSSSEGHFSELDDVLETIEDDKSKKRKRSEAFSEEDTPRKKIPKLRIPNS